MGVRVSFYIGSKDGALTHFLESPLQDFRAWHLEQLREWPEDVDARLTPIIDDVLDRRAAALCPQSGSHAWLIDRVVDCFYGEFCDHVQSHLLKGADDACLYVRGYANLDAVGSVIGPDLLRTWQYLLNGRALGREATHYPYDSADGVYRLGFWTRSEAAQLHSRFKDRGPLSALVPTDNVGAMESARRAVATAFQAGTGLIISVG